MSYNANLSSASGNAAPFANRDVRPARAVHTVKPGETLAGIANQHGTDYMTLIQLNNHQLGRDGSGLQPGMRLEL